jgi:hypothetical protein
MPPPERRSVPDNLDPLVDTLSNVVGILVIVVALTQIQLGDALARVVELDRMRGEHERVRDALPTEAEQQAMRRDVLILRTDADLDEAATIAQETLSKLAELDSDAHAESGALESLDVLERRLGASQEKLDESLRMRDQRARYEARLQTVPKQMVARLPDPQVFQGQESWILVRYGRIYLSDREALLDNGSRAIGRILQDGVDRRIRGDEFDSVARYLRKREIGDGNFRWQLQTEPDIRVQLEWRSQDAGIAHNDLSTSRAMREWLAARSPELDLIKFHVWADSFEAYLAAREVVEKAGFRAGWIGYEIEQDFDLGVRFGPPEPRTGPVEVD